MHLCCCLASWIPVVEAFSFWLNEVFFFSECSGVKWKGRMVVYSLLSPWLWGALKTVVHLGLTSTCLYFVARPYTGIFCVRTVLDIIWAPTSGRLVKPECAGWNVCWVSAGCFWGVQALWSRPFEKDLPVILPACPALPPSSTHCAAVAWDGLPNASGMGGLGPKSRKTLVSQLDPRSHTGL